ncbi:MAG: TerB family tellurite resistance protein [Rhodobacteraceae bacterium]|jgi:uncharacterized tellurite resistance protein B-like protein|nr:TerB family tellurite resistance protein [Paracoccaceae bacterium]
MIASLLRRLAGDAVAAAPLAPADARLALAALLVRVARADGRYAPAEIAGIDAVLARRHGLADAAVGRLRAEAEAVEAAAPDTVRFTRVLKEAVPHEERAGLIEALWEVALADGRRDAEEDAKLRLVASLLGITDRDSGLARQRVEARLGR